MGFQPGRCTLHPTFSQPPGQHHCVHSTWSSLFPSVRASYSSETCNIVKAYIAHIHPSVGSREAAGAILPTASVSSLCLQLSPDLSVDWPYRVGLDELCLRMESNPREHAAEGSKERVGRAPGELALIRGWEHGRYEGFGTPMATGHVISVLLGADVRLA